MQAVSELEKRFSAAIANLELSIDTGANDAENAALSSRITELEAELLQKDQRIEALEADVENSSKNDAADNEQVTALNASLETAQQEVTDLKTSLATMEEIKTDQEDLVADLQSQISDLENQKSVSGKGDEPDTDAQISALNAEIAEKSTRIEELEAIPEKYQHRLRVLRKKLRQIRESAKNNVLDAENLNSAMEAELASLQFQREEDLNEVNRILQKLAPLVEGN